MSVWSLSISKVKLCAELGWLCDLGQVTLFFLWCEEGGDYTYFICHERMGHLHDRDSEDNLEHVLRAGMREGWKFLKLGKPSGADMGMILLVASSCATIPAELFLHRPLPTS